jgi:hypothetical protein
MKIVHFASMFARVIIVAIFCVKTAFFIGFVSVIDDRIGI